MGVKQISIFVENKPGKMYEMTQVLADNNIDMRALSLSEADGFGIVRMIVNDAYAATTVLKDAGYVNKLTTVVITAIPDEPGSLSKVLSVLNKENINLLYMYAVQRKSVSKEAYMVLKVSDHQAASIALKKAGVKLVEDVVEL